MIFISFLLILFVFVFIPFPLKINFHFSQGSYLLKFLFIKIDLKKNKKINFYKKYTKSSIFNILTSFNNSNFKPVSSIKMNIIYSCKDAMLTSIVYGLLSSFYYHILFIFSIPFNVHKFIFNINPSFTDEYMVKFEFSSIIFISIAQIINIIFLIKKARRKPAYAGNN